MRFLTTEELLSMPTPTYLIDGILERNSFNVLYGSPAAGKSFLALDIALHIATGRPWMGHEVQQGSVIYVAAEGYQSMARRVRAWLAFYNITSEALRDLNWVVEPVSLLGGVQTLNSFLFDCVGSLRGDDWDVEDEEGPSLRAEAPALELVIFDTLSRCIQGADENDAKDMNTVVQWLDQLRDHEFTGMSLSTLVVHHSSKSAPVERGSSVLRGAADTMMHLKGDGTGPVLTCSKQKNAEPFEKKNFLLHTIGTEAVLVGRMEYQAMRMQGVIPLIPPKGPAGPPIIGVRQKRFMAALSASASPEGMGLSEIGRIIQITPAAAFRVRESLRRLEYVYKDPDSGRAFLTMLGAQRLVDEKILRPEDVPEQETDEVESES